MYLKKKFAHILITTSYEVTDLEIRKGQDIPILCSRDAWPQFGVKFLIISSTCIIITRI